ncbi:MAG: hypothetical protein K2X94_02115 [Amoebophilaceae bacterium]|nr:hypothetical protein [Amoebophilaceae bacterium]
MHKDDTVENNEECVVCLESIGVNKLVVCPNGYICSDNPHLVCTNCAINLCEEYAGQFYHRPECRATISKMIAVAVAINSGKNDTLTCNLIKNCLLNIFGHTVLQYGRVN